MAAIPIARNANMHKFTSDAILGIGYEAAEVEEVGREQWVRIYLASRLMQLESL